MSKEQIKEEAVNETKRQAETTGVTEFIDPLVTVVGGALEVAGDVIGGAAGGVMEVIGEILSGL